MNPRALSADTHPFLFLDRDGVINVRLVDDYVKSWNEFQFIAGTPSAIARFSKVFRRVFIVTNQRGIARGLMTSADLDAIHGRMLEAIRETGGRIDAIYHCPHDRETGCDCRKPRIGLAHHAKEQYPEIEFSQSIMVGDSDSDMRFAEAAGMARVFVGTAPPARTTADLIVPSLSAFADTLG
jgi:D-glycero-D-manno-heptose 1,7-bisphosphate phosphatase